MKNTSRQYRVHSLASLHVIQFVGEWIECEQKRNNPLEWRRTQKKNGIPIYRNSLFWRWFSRLIRKRETNIVCEASNWNRWRECHFIPMANYGNPKYTHKLFGGMLCVRCSLYAFNRKQKPQQCTSSRCGEKKYRYENATKEPTIKKHSKISTILNAKIAKTSTIKSNTKLWLKNCLCEYRVFAYFVAALIYTTHTIRWPFHVCLVSQRMSMCIG